MPRTALDASARTSELAASSQVAAAGGSRSASGLAARAASAGISEREVDGYAFMLPRPRPSRFGVGEHAGAAVARRGRRAVETNRASTASRSASPSSTRAIRRAARPGRVGDRRIPVGAARLVPLEHALGVQPGEDRHHRGVGELAADPVPDLAGRQRGPAALQHIEHRGLQFAGRAPSPARPPRRRPGLLVAHRLPSAPLVGYPLRVCRNCSAATAGKLRGLPVLSAGWSATSRRGRRR